MADSPPPPGDGPHAERPLGETAGGFCPAGSNPAPGPSIALLRGPRDGLT